MLSQQKADGGLNSGSRSQFAGKTEEGLAVVANDHQKNVPKLADVGISKDLSSRAQKLAAVPEAEFEAEIGEWSDNKIAKDFGFSNNFVGRVRTSLCSEQSDPPAERTYTTKHGTTAVMNTAKIGKAQPVAKPQTVAAVRDAHFGNSEVTKQERTYTTSPP